MRVVVIGGTGHAGTYLVPRLVAAGYEVTCISRGRRQPYFHHPAWQMVQQIAVDRDEAEKSGTFGGRVQELEPDVVIDMICFTLESARHLTESLHGRVRHFLHCGTIWVHGSSAEVPTGEDQNRNPFGEYGIQKAAIEDYLLGQSRRHGFPATVLHPGHITGRGWVPINPAGHLSKNVYTSLARGEEVMLPNLGMETLHHVHADDIAQIALKATNRWSVAVGESFHVVSAAALSMRGYAEALASWFGQKAHLKFLPWKDFKAVVSEYEAELTWDHIAHSPNCSIAKAQHLLDYSPRYSSLEAVQDALGWLIEQGQLEV